MEMFVKEMAQYFISRKKILQNDTVKSGQSVNLQAKQIFMAVQIVNQGRPMKK